MKPVEFPGQNAVYAKDQPPYIPLPSYRAPDGMVVSCWGLTWRDRLRVLVSGKVWLSLLTFNRPLQPSLLSVVSPLQLVEKERS